MVKPTFFISAIILIALILTVAANAQTTAFKYQGSLTDAGQPANGAFQMQFKLFDALSGGTQIGTTIIDVPATAVNGAFSATLDFGASVFGGANRWLEIAVRHNSGESYTVLSPRQQIASAPYSVKTLSAGQADVALDAQKLGGVNADQFVTTASVGSAFIKNDTALQAANFNINGSGSIGVNLAVGTPNPTARLTVVGGGFPNNLRVSDSNTTATALDLVNTSTGGKPWRLQSVGSGTVNRIGNFELWEAANGASPAITVQPNGNVGINNAVPSNALDVYGFFRASHPAGGNVVSETTGGTNAWAKFWARTPAQQWSIGTSNNFNGNQLYFSNENTGLIQMAIMPGGNVGIGTTNPLAKLQVNGEVIIDNGGDAVIHTGTANAEQNRYLAVINSPASRSASGLKAGGVLVADSYTYANPGKNDLIVKGNVGINTTNPQFALDVQGYAHVIQGDNGTTALCRNPAGVIAFCSSSLRYKTHVAPYKLGMSLIDRLRPITFDWKADGTPDIGLAAEEVADIEPLLVTRNDKGEIEGVKYGQLSTLFINAFKEQQAQIEALKLQLNAMKALLCSENARAEICDQKEK
jgi:hypothetical protein